ncbi:hypothetical protein ACFYPC_11360 [Streptomyces sp. NPDC005808]|uniref:hypothetical protein n=1 Tax=Streptomyces sp. NPDC005808 TaxID=3364734 RepID=UPI00369AFD59
MTETIYIRGEGGGIHAMDLPLHESVEQRLARGQLTRVNQDGSSYTDGTTEAGPSESSDPAADKSARPAVNASKSEWIAYVVGQGHLSAEDAANLTKADLIELAS